MAADPRTDGKARFRARHEAERAASALPPLLVAAERIAATVEQGVHGRRRVGTGESFWQFRRYETGDSPRQIDWRQTGKTDQVFIRENEWAAAQSVWLWRDASPSMLYRSGNALPGKRDRADLLLLALASLLVRAGERVALLDGGYRPSSGRTALDRLALQLLHGADDGSPPERGDAWRDMPRFQVLPRHCHLVLLGDFLGPVEAMDEIARRYAARGVHGHLVQVLDPAEEALPFTGRTRFEGMEAEGAILIKRVENVAQDYRRRMEDHKAALADMARALGWSYTLHRTDRPPEHTLLSLYTTLAEFGA